MSEIFPDVPREVLGGLRNRYAERHRAYHDWSHIEAIMRHFKQLADRLDDPVAVELAVLFHDAVYEPRETDNEKRSADLMLSLLSDRCEIEVLERAHRLILATQVHAIPDGLHGPEAEDMALFLDMDLAILGADQATFDQYEAGVRHEYAHVPDEAFRAGRAAILERFESRPWLYFSTWGSKHFEAAARSNLARSLERLRQA